MFLKTLLLLLAIGLGAVMGGQLQLKVPASAKITRLQEQTDLLSSKNPEKTKSCFSYYKPILANISDTYEADYNACNEAYEASIDAIDDAYNNSHVQASAESACQNLFDCNSIVGLVEVFECYADMAAANSKVMYEISSNATQLAAQISEKYRIVETQQNICINNAEKTYVQNTSDTYEALNNCLNNDMTSFGTRTPATTTKPTTPTTPRTTTTYITRTTTSSPYVTTVFP